MTIQLRPFAAEDYPAWTVLRNTIRPDHLVTAEDLERQDAQFDPKCLLLRFVAEQAGELAGVGQINQETWRFHPQKFHLAIWVQPALQRQGIGKLLYDQLLDQVTPKHPLALRTSLREDQKAGMRFAARRGFREEMRAWTARLDVATFKPAPFVGLVERVLAKGIRITTLAALQKSDPKCWQKLYELDRSTGADLPGPEIFTHPAYEQWEKFVRYEPNVIPEAYFVALDGPNYIGVSNLTRLNGTNELEVGYTAVERAYRGRGIALALKLNTIAYARATDAPAIRTDNNSNNAPILHINTALGFKRGLAWLTLINSQSGRLSV